MLLNTFTLLAEANEIRSGYGGLIAMGLFALGAIAVGIWWLNR